ncbi:MAG: hypothetical protein P8J79_10400 [Halioglobus sp.]|nr:hypothetical protein [Halioglobus sp.]
MSQHGNDNGDLVIGPAAVDSDSVYDLAPDCFAVSPTANSVLVTADGFIEQPAG